MERCNVSKAPFGKIEHAFVGYTLICEGCGYSRLVIVESV